MRSQPFYLRGISGRLGVRGVVGSREKFPSHLVSVFMATGSWRLSDFTASFFGWTGWAGRVICKFVLSQTRSEYKCCNFVGNGTWKLGNGDWGIGIFYSSRVVVVASLLFTGRGERVGHESPSEVVDHCPMRLVGARQVARWSGPPLLRASGVHALRRSCFGCLPRTRATAESRKLPSGRCVCLYFFLLRRLCCVRFVRLYRGVVGWWA
ncbi:hypothetical protein BDY21DRAFT_140719 [Lineolata rhizophorae]|uniref:Uncharacterized protein n=1 Tax=Lineolata rhizophorae TaxID=578093 RepID=A0A6A6PB49_9PEZI|nr:hypothetical protein BDY21DRAFT_140719 [Lineolata rhizophorae]